MRKNLSNTTYFRSLLGLLLVVFMHSCHVEAQHPEKDIKRGMQPNPNTYPKDYFRNPLDIPIYLAGNFGELRNNHFHNGIDIKTNQKEGLEVHAAADGYISRINVSPEGYGNALYIDHPNGYTTVYGHLQRFTPEIQAIIKKEQYKAEKFHTEFYPDKNMIPVKKGDVIAYSGNTGGSGGPHLHFEIRDTKTEEPINPFQFGLNNPDTKPPNILGLYIYPENGEVNGSNQKYTFPNGLEFKSPIYASGTIGFGVKVYDKQNGADNNNGVYKIQVIVNEKPVYTFTANRLAFTETRAINAVIDYPAAANYNSWIYQCWAEPGDPLRLYNDLNDLNGKIALEDGKTYNIKLIASDYEGNHTDASFIVVGKNNALTAKDIDQSTIFHYNKENNFRADGVEINFPKGIFYNDFVFTYAKKEGKYHIGSLTEPVHSYYTIAFDPPSDIPVAQLNKVMVKRLYKRQGKWKSMWYATAYKNGKLWVDVKDFGIFSLEVDETKPTVTPLNIKENTIFTASNNVIKFKITDSQSDIEGFSANIDGKWVLTEYDEKNDLLTLNLKNENIEAGKHHLELKVWDEKNNTTTYNVDFNKNN